MRVRVRFWLPHSETASPDDIERSYSYGTRSDTTKGSIWLFEPKGQKMDRPLLNARYLIKAINRYPMLLPP